MSATPSTRMGGRAMTTDQVNAVFINAIARNVKPVQTPASRVKARKALAAAQVAALRTAIGTIRRQARETPAWANGYNSAITALELQIAAIEVAA